MKYLYFISAFVIEFIKSIVCFQCCFNINLKSKNKGAFDWLGIKKSCHAVQVEV